MRAGALGEPDALAFQIGNGANAGVGGNQNALPVGDRRSRDIDDVGVRGLGKDRRGIADCAKVDAAGAHGLQQWRPRRELDPLDADLLRGEALLKHGLLPRDHQHAGLLVTDPDFLDGCLRTHLPRQRRRRRCAKRQFKELTTLHHNLLNDRPVVRCDAGDDDDAPNMCRVLCKNSNDRTVCLGRCNRFIAGYRSTTTHFSLVTRDAQFLVTGIQAARRRDRGGDGAMNGKHLKFFICHLSPA